MNLKEKAISFLQLAGTGKVTEAYDKFVAIDFIHHNPYFKGDRESLKLAMEEAHISSPNKSIEIKLVTQENDTVITHSQIIKEGMTLAAVHIFSFTDEKISEFWDVVQLSEENSPNENGPF